MRTTPVKTWSATSASTLAERVPAAGCGTEVVPEVTFSGGAFAIRFLRGFVMGVVPDLFALAVPRFAAGFLEADAMRFFALA